MKILQKTEPIISSSGCLVWILERRFVGFSTDVPVQRKLSRCAAGLIGFYAVSLILMPWIKAWFPGPAGTILSCFVQMFYIVFIFPWCARLAEGPQALQPGPAGDPA